MLLEIHELLKKGLSNREIANIYNISVTTVNNINNGKIKKYIIKDVEYPIKKLKN